MLRILSSLSFFDQSLAKVANSNKHLMALMLDQAARQQTQHASTNDDNDGEAMTDTN
jgi:hypothetical protein